MDSIFAATGSSSSEFTEIFNKRYKLSVKEYILDSLMRNDPNFCLVFLNTTPSFILNSAQERIYNTLKTKFRNSAPKDMTINQMKNQIEFYEIYIQMLKNSIPM